MSGPYPALLVLNHAELCMNGYAKVAWFQETKIRLAVLLVNQVIDTKANVTSKLLAVNARSIIDSLPFLKLKGFR